MKIAIVHNLPSGGGLRMLESIIQRYKNIVDIDIFVIGEKEPKEISGVNNTFIKVKPWKGFFLYNFWILSILPLIHKRISKQYKWRKYSFVLFTHD